MEAIGSLGFAGVEDDDEWKNSPDESMAANPAMERTIAAAQRLLSRTMLMAEPLHGLTEPLFQPNPRVANPRDPEPSFPWLRTYGFHIREVLPLTAVDCFDFMNCHVVMETNAHELLNNLHIPRGIPMIPPSVGVLQIDKDTLVVYYKGGGTVAGAVATDPYICPIHIPFVVYWGSVSVRNLGYSRNYCEMDVDGMLVKVDLE
ncbi:hypothetical protein E3N88_46284 [Mikania micrantha]|uniref:Uncharacterized protein n=1 Tax=Mikania micrantha TaxID=192012 RepID=A0A5N6L6R7_9ASTR|nr:hypothetical protein E3N88_46284 [Mikania micrantha]